jgi:hypothetical protein
MWLNCYDIFGGGRQTFSVMSASVTKREPPDASGAEDIDCYRGNHQISTQIDVELPISEFFREILLLLSKNDPYTLTR